MTDSSRKVHSRLLRLQKRIYRALQSESERLIGKTPPSIRNYEREHLEDFRDLPRKPNAVTKADLIEEIRDADVTFIADYHTFAQAQRTAIRIIREAVLPKETWWLGLEMIPSHYQSELDAFQRGELSVERFLEAIHYAEEWGFPWENYAPLLEWAISHGVRLVALNRPRQLRAVDARSSASHEELKARDRWAAGIITDLFANAARAKNRGGGSRPRMIVLYGELHVSRSHLPQDLTEVSRKFLKRPLTSVSVHQNNETLYWKMASLRREDRVEILRLRRGSFCVLSSTPWSKLQSLVTWAEDGMPLARPSATGISPIARGDRSRLSAPPPGFDPWSSGADDGEDFDHAFDYLSLMQTYGKTIAEFLRMPPPSFESINVFSIRDADFIEDTSALARDGFSRDDLYLIRYHVLNNQKVYIPVANIAYLASPSENGTAEAAALHLLRQRSRSDFFFDRSEDGFFRLVLDSAFAFFGSLILNPHRKCDLAWDHEKRIAELRGRTDAPLGFPHELDARRLALAVLESKDPAKSPALLISFVRARRNSPALIFGARYVGQVLGRALHHAVLQGSIDADQIAAIFFSAQRSGKEGRIRYLTRARVQYQELRRLIAAVPLASSKTETL